MRTLNGTATSEPSLATPTAEVKSEASAIDEWIRLMSRSYALWPASLHSDRGLDTTASASARTACIEV